MKTAGFREPMPMPDPSFPIKLIPRQEPAFSEGASLFSHHWHEHLEILYFISGSAVIECGSVPVSCRSGDLCVINSNELHYGISASDGLSYYTIIVDMSLLHSHTRDAVETKYITPIARNQLLFRNRVAGDDEAARCTLAMIQEMSAREPGYELAVKSHLYALLAALVRKHTAPESEMESYRNRWKELERLSPVFRYIDERYAEKLTVQELADVAGLSRYHFSRQFKRVTDKTPIDYVNLIRIHKAERLLRSEAMNITEIALATGFGDIFYFSRLFKRLKKVSPAKWRSQHT